MNRETIDEWLERAMLALVLGVLVFGTLSFRGVSRLVDPLLLFRAGKSIVGVWQPLLSD